MPRPTRAKESNEVTSVEAKRPKRVPLGAGKNILTAPPKEGFRRRFINDEKDRIARAQAAGYTVVEDGVVPIGDEDVVNRNSSIGTGAEVVVNRNGMRAVLMEIPEEYAKEDDEAKARNIDEKERAITSKGNEQGYYGNTKVS